MHIHLIGVSGSGMASLAGLLTTLGHHVTGSDHAFHPPMGPALRSWGVQTMLGYDPKHLIPAPDLVIVGNVCTRDNPEAQSAMLHGHRVVSMPEAIETLILPGRTSYVISGTHGKTTNSSLVAHFLTAAGKQPGFLIGGIPLNFGTSFSLGDPSGPFVIEGDEYDSAFFEKQPKFWRYRPEAVLLSALDHDHIDIYPTMQAYRQAFREFIHRIPPTGILVAHAGDPEVRQLAAMAKCEVIYYGIQHQDWGQVDPLWQAAAVETIHGNTAFDLFAGGSFCGRVFSPLNGNHNLLNTIGAMALCAHHANVPIPNLIASLRRFQGVKRRQELLGITDGVHVYDDFAHHPSAVKETLAGLRSKYATTKIIAVFEPRSATACRKLHQHVYPNAFKSADFTILAPLGRPEIAETERLDIYQLAKDIGTHAWVAPNVSEIIEKVCSLAQPGDAVLIMSNGAFDGLYDRLLTALTYRSQNRHRHISSTHTV
jgi:UDP-N-acetylmuramate: L-alanyl-gamma-D-glutamyl-meso-diaminopimelate ligase